MTDETGVWKPAARIAFRFAFCYVAIYATYIVDMLVREVAYQLASADVTPFPANLLHQVVPWFARHALLLHRDIVIFSNGSADTTYDWVLIALNVCVAVAAAAVWSVLDRKRTSYVRLYAWLRFAAAMLLSAELLLYGFDKVIPAQFGPMTLSKLVTPFGSLTRMQVLWTFMSASTGYTMFAGSMEVAAALLLLIPRLRALGAIVAAIAMANVFALNVFYDVPVKLFSFHLLLLALVVLAPELSRLANLLVFDRPPGPSAPSTLFDNLKLDRAVVGLSWVVAAAFGTCLFVSTLASYRERLAKIDPAVPFYGVWKVDDFVAAAPSGTLAGSSLLERFVFESPNQVVVEAGGVMWSRTLWVNQKSREMALAQRFGDAWSARFSYQQQTPDTLALDGRVDGVPFRAKLHREDESHLELVTGQINLISEYPH
ncbi:MAG TPA: hypothetical protein VK760_11570 [Candidatus Acidoferrales bacterium]|nr:hypothetical protein [Candidatus Acidoferrales bacterium]